MRSKSRNVSCHGHLARGEVGRSFPEVSTTAQRLRVHLFCFLAAIVSTYRHGIRFEDFSQSGIGHPRRCHLANIRRFPSSLIRGNVSIERGGLRAMAEQGKLHVLIVGAGECVFV